MPFQSNYRAIGSTSTHAGLYLEGSSSAHASAEGSSAAHVLAEILLLIVLVEAFLLSFE